MYTGKLNSIIDRYDPEHDLDPNPSAPPVTWREYNLAELLMKAVRKIEELEERIKALEGN